MKSAEEWIALHQIEVRVPGYGIEGEDLEQIDIIKQIQLDAWKQGMSDAANRCNIFNLPATARMLQEMANEKSEID